MEKGFNVVASFFKNYEQLKSRYDVRIQRYASQLMACNQEEAEAIKEGIEDTKKLIANLEEEKKIISSIPHKASHNPGEYVPLSDLTDGERFRFVDEDENWELISTDEESFQRLVKNIKSGEEKTIDNSNEMEVLVVNASLITKTASFDEDSDDIAEKLQDQEKNSKTPDEDSDKRVLNTWDQNGYAMVFEFLDDLRASGETNMWGARPYIVDEFDVENDIARKLLLLWMKFYRDGTKTAEERAKEAFNFNQGDLFKKEASYTFSKADLEKYGKIWDSLMDYKKDDIADKAGVDLSEFNEYPSWETLEHNAKENIAYRMNYNEKAWKKDSSLRVKAESEDELMKRFKPVDVYNYEEMMGGDFDEGGSFRSKSQKELDTEKTYTIPAGNAQMLFGLGIENPGDTFEVKESALGLQPGKYKIVEEISSKGPSGPWGNFTNFIVRRIASINKKAFEGNDLIPGGIADNEPESAFTPEALEKGTKVEMEHTHNEKIAREIASDHLKESVDYYDKLELLENKSFEELKKL